MALREAYLRDFWLAWRWALPARATRLCLAALLYLALVAFLADPAELQATSGPVQFQAAAGCSLRLLGRLSNTQAVHLERGQVLFGGLSEVSWKYLNRDVHVTVRRRCRS